MLRHTQFNHLDGLKEEQNQIHQKNGDGERKEHTLECWICTNSSSDQKTDEDGRTNLRELANDSEQSYVHRPHPADEAHVVDFGRVQHLLQENWDQRQEGESDEDESNSPNFGNAGHRLRFEAIVGSKEVRGQWKCRRTNGLQTERSGLNHGRK